MPNAVTSALTRLDQWMFRSATLSDLGVPSRLGKRAGSVTVTNSTALTHSAVWACLRLRANLISSLPVDQFTRTNGVQRELPKDDFLTRPGALFIGGSRVTIREWLYATQFDLDRAGNCFGLQSRNSMGEVVRVDLLPLESVVVAVRGGVLSYRVDGQPIDELDVWHERQYVVPGLPVGLSPIANAAMAIGQYLSAQEFALDWFSGGAVPAALLRNKAKAMSGDEAQTAKDRWNASVSNGGTAVLGGDWEYSMVGALANQAEFLGTQKWSVSEVCRFLDVPGDMIDAETSTGSITYASVTQRNVQLLVLSLGPAIGRREDALTSTRRKNVYVKLNSDAFLRMDPKSRSEMLAIGVTNRAVTPNEWRELDNRPPLTPAQVTEFSTLFAPKVNPAPSVNVTNNQPDLSVDARTSVDAPVSVRDGLDVQRDFDTREDLNIAITEAVREVVAPLRGALEVLTERDAARMDEFKASNDHLADAVADLSERVAAPAPLIRKRIVTDEDGKITEVIEERAE